MQTCSIAIKTHLHVKCYTPRLRELIIWNVVKKYIYIDTILSVDILSSYAHVNYSICAVIEKIFTSEVSLICRTYRFLKRLYKRLQYVGHAIILAGTCRFLRLCHS